MKIKWAPKLRQDRLRRLYRAYMAGLADESQADDVGLSLYLRCRDSLLVGERGCRCPACGGQFFVDRVAGGVCACGFSVTAEAYHKSYRETQLGPGGAGPAFEAFVRDYPLARGLDQKMIRIDTLIHAFHIDSKLNLPNRIAGNNLIEGSLEDVVAFLDELSGVRPEGDLEYRETVDRMWKRRRGQIPLPGKKPRAGKGPDAGKELYD